MQLSRSLGFDAPRAAGRYLGALSCLKRLTIRHSQNAF